MVEHFLEFPIKWPSGLDNTQFMNMKYQVPGQLVAHGQLFTPGSRDKPGAITLKKRKVIYWRSIITHILRCFTFDASMKLVTGSKQPLDMPRSFKHHCVSGVMRF